MSKTVMKECCGLCPYSRKNTLFLGEERATEFAYQAENPYNDFVCHKTGVTLESNELNDLLEISGNIVRGEKSLLCAGFHAMQQIMNDKDLEIKYDQEDHFTDTHEMIEHHVEKGY